MNTKELVQGARERVDCRRHMLGAINLASPESEAVAEHLASADDDVLALCEALDNLQNEYRGALLPFARAGFRQTNRFAAYHGACFMPWAPEDVVALEVRDEVIDRALYALGVYQEHANGVTVNAGILEDGG